jgi:guanylate kinase
MSSSNTNLQKYGLIVVSAPSGAGKSTLCAELLKKYSNRVSLSISSTSRAPRGTEVHGKEYFFLTKEEFKKKIDSNIFAEWASVHDNYYGTSKETLNQFWAQQKHVLLDIDVQGAESLRNTFPEKCFTVFVAPPSIEVLEQRLRGRGTETEAAIQKRMSNARHEMSHLDKFDFVIVNDDFNTAFERLEKEVVSFMDQLEGGVWQKHQ